MRTLLLLPLVLSLPAFAGTTVTSSKEAVVPGPNPCITTWFAGASVGYLTELEEPMYHLHAGVTNSCWNIAGWDVGVFLEVGYTEKDDSYRPRSINRNDFLTGEPSNDDFDVDDMEDALQFLADLNSFTTGYNPRTSYDLDIIPITLNVKFERALTGNLNFYLGGGLGIARVDLDIDAGGFYGDFSDDDWVFVSQIFTGMSYNVNPAFQVYGGARWLYIADADLGDRGLSGTLEVGSDYLFELGARYHF